MPVKPMVAWRAAFLNTFFLAVCLLLFPAISQAKAAASHGFEKSDLVTTGDFMEYAAIHEVDIHELYFNLRPYEGTRSCLMCHASEGVEMLNTGHFKWARKSENIVGLEGQAHGKNDLINNFCIATATNEPCVII